MNPNELHVLRTIRDENHALLGGYEPELERLHEARLILRAASGWVLSDLGREWLMARNGRGVTN
jgi:hypothetical protein